MAKSIAYLNTILKDKKRNLTKLIQLSLLEKRGIESDKLDKLPGLSQKKHRLLHTLETLERDPIFHGEEVPFPLKAPKNPSDKFLISECQTLLKDLRKLAQRFGQITRENEVLLFLSKLTLEETKNG